MMVESGETLGTQGKVRDLKNIRRKKGIGKLSDGSRTTNPIDITTLLSLALVIDPNCIFHGVLESCSFPKGGKDVNM